MAGFQVTTEESLLLTSYLGFNALFTHYPATRPLAHYLRSVYN
jgi:hypothetical protein